MKMNALTTLAVTILTVMILDDSTGCRYVKFQKELPDELQCTPFDKTELWRLRMECGLRVLAGNPYRYRIFWFHRDIQGYFAILKHNVFWSEFGSEWINKTFTESMLGEYWCRVVYYLAYYNAYYYLGRSHIITIHAPECYNTSLDTCSGVQSIKSSRCIDEYKGISNILPPICLSVQPNSSLNIYYTPTLSNEIYTNIQSESGLDFIIIRTNFPILPGIAFSISSNNFLLSPSQDTGNMNTNTPMETEMIVSNSNSHLRGSNIVIIIIALVILLGILIITSGVVIVCVYFMKERKGHTNYAVNGLDLKTQSDVNTSLPLAEPVDYRDPVRIQRPLQDECQTVLLSSSNELQDPHSPNHEPYYSVINEEECYDRLKRNHLSNQKENWNHTGPGSDHTRFNDEYSTIANVSNYGYSDLENKGDMVVMDTAFDNPNYTAI